MQAEFCSENSFLLGVRDALQNIPNNGGVQFRQSGIDSRCDVVGDYAERVCRDRKATDNDRVWNFDCLAFTGQERTAMRNFIKRPITVVWNQQFISGKTVSITEIDSAFRPRKDYYPLNGWENIPNGYVEMSAPLFLRNNSLCLIYWGHACGMTCGYGTLSIYIKHQGTWKEFASLYSWDS